MTGPCKESTNQEMAKSSPWTSEHHLVGKKKTHNLLVSAGAEYRDVDSYIVSKECVEAISFEPENAMERKPALWRTCVADHRTDYPALAIDLVASDWQAKKDEVPNLPTKLIQECVSERLNDLILDHVYKNILPDLVLKAALEEIRSHYLRSATADPNNGSRRQTSSKSSSNTQTTPLYYAKHPNTYLKPPEPIEKEPSTNVVVQFTPSNLLNRIKAGCALAWSQVEDTRRPLSVNEPNSSDRRASSRLARIVEKKEEHTSSSEETRYLWGVINGGTVASFLLDRLTQSSEENQREQCHEKSSFLNGDKTSNSDETNKTPGKASFGALVGTGEQHKSNKENEEGEKQSMNEDGDSENSYISKLSNPYMRLTDFTLLEWLGRKTAKLLSNSDLQKVFPSLMIQRKGKKKKKEYKGGAGRLTSHLLTSIDRQVWDKIVSPSSCLDDSSARFFLESHTHDDVSEIELWETAYFARASFSLRVADESDLGGNKRKPVDNHEQLEKAFKDRKAWETTRYKAIHTGYTIWASWWEAALEWKKKEIQAGDPEPKSGPAQDQDFAVAQAIASEGDSSKRRRTTRRGGDASGVFYGNQSGLSLKQLMETLLRLVSDNSLKTLTTLLEKVPDESTDPMRRMRNALGRLVWKRKQMSQLQVKTEWTDSPMRGTVFAIHFMNSKKMTLQVEEDMRRLIAYMLQLNETELHLRRLVLSSFTRLPVALIASAGDDRPGTLETADNGSFYEPESVDWQTNGHELIGCNIYRPATTYNTDANAVCQWFRIERYVPSVFLDANETDTPAQDKPFIGSAKDNVAVERRARFYAVPSSGDAASFASDPIVLTEAQVFAGKKAGETQTTETSLERGDEHPFAGDQGIKVALVPTSDGADNRQINGEVVGWKSTNNNGSEMEHKILFLPESRKENDKTAFWATLSGSEEGGFTCTKEGEKGVFSVLQFDYHVSSTAFKECRAIIGHLQRHSKAGPFLEPVDPEALNIPNYFDVIKHPMDIATLSGKLEGGEYSNINPKDTIGLTPVSRMLNGPFRKDVELIFDNATTFNPPDDWIYQAAVSLKKYILKKIEQVSTAADELVTGRRRPRSSAYVEYDSDADMYAYESDKDDDYEESRQSRKRREPRSGWSGEDSSSKAIERVIKLQKVLGVGDSQGLRPPLSHLPINSNPETFSLADDWNCRRSEGNQSSENHNSLDVEDELSELITLRSHVEEKQASCLRRSTRSTVEPMEGNNSARGIASDLIFSHSLLEKLGDSNIEPPKNRTEVESVQERLHEEYYAKFYHAHHSDLTHIIASAVEEIDSEQQSLLTGIFNDGCFPPFLGKISPVSSPSFSGEVTWEIRSPNVVPAIRWVIRGLIASGHLSEIEPLTIDSLQSGAIIANNVYYIDPRASPFDVLHQKEIQRRKRSNQGESEDDEEEIELSEYEKRRAERVARNADRLKSLGLA